MLQLHGLGKRFATRQGPIVVLEGLDLVVPSGCFATLHGPSGCGKSTLLAIIGGLLHPDAGRVEIDGTDLWACSAAARAALRRRRLGFVFQHFHLLPYLDVRGNVLLAAADEAAAQRVDDLVERIGLGHRRRHRPGELSAGEQQRCAIARALVNTPALLLADEPTGNLDQDNGAMVLEALAGAAAGGATVLMVTHDDRAAARADARHLLAGGRCAPALAAGGRMQGS